MNKKHCDFCNNKKFSCIADNLYACKDCEKVGFYLIFNSKSRDYYWKKKNDTIVDFEKVIPIEK